MFGRIYGESAVHAVFEAWDASLEDGRDPLTWLESLKECFLHTNAWDLSRVLTLYFEGPVNRRSVLAAYTALALTVTERAKTAAINFCLQRDTRDEALAVLLLSLLAGLDSIPREFSRSIRTALSSGQIHRQVAAAMCAPKLDGCGDEIAITSLRTLQDAVRSHDPALRMLAAGGLAQFRVHVTAHAKILQDFLTHGIEGVDTTALRMNIVTRLNSAFEKEQPLIDQLKRIAVNQEENISVRACILRMLGHICPTRQDIREWLMNRFIKESDWRLILGSGLGLGNQHLEFPEAGREILVNHLGSNHPEVRFAAGSILGDIAPLLDERLLTAIAQHANEESDEQVRLKLLQCMVRSNPVGIDIAMESAKGTWAISRAMWEGVLSQHCQRHPQEFMEAFFRCRDARLDEMLPVILGDVERFSGVFVDHIQSALESDSAVERSNALRSLSRVDAQLAGRLTPQLVNLYLYGSPREQNQAEAILLRFGSATHGYLQDDVVGLHSQQVLDRFQHLQRLVGVSEGLVRDIELVRVGNHDWIRLFVQVGEILEKQGTLSYRLLAPHCGVSVNTIRLNLDKLAARLSLSMPPDQKVTLVAGGSRQPRSLTDAGKYWLARCRRYLATIDSQPQEIVGQDE